MPKYTFQSTLVRAGGGVHSISLENVTLPDDAAARQWLIEHHHQWVKPGIWRSYYPLTLSRFGLSQNDPRFAECPNVVIARQRRAKMTKTGAGATQG